MVINYNKCNMIIQLLMMQGDSMFENLPMLALAGVYSIARVLCVGDGIEEV